LFAADVRGLGDVELIIVGAVRAFDMGILLAVALVVLNDSATQAAEQLPQLGELEPGLATELFAVVDGEDDLGLDAIRPQPRDGPQVEAEAVGPGFLSGLGNEFEA